MLCMVIADQYAMKISEWFLYAHLTGELETCLGDARRVIHLEDVSPSSVERTMVPLHETNLVSFPPCAYDMGMAVCVKCHEEFIKESFAKHIDDLQKSESLQP